jgi:hypothetical protein
MKNTDESKPIDEPWQGTAGGYINHGCRCERCRKAHAKAVSIYREGQKARGLCVNCSAEANRGLRCAKHADARLAYARRAARARA